ncbi:ESX-1 secretion-associated protein [Mycobacterium sp. MBM]|nr:ESX-1 secretion-associated protein [Mycobacterium sp. MBM]
MGHLESARMDAGAVLAVANRYDDIAERVDAARRRCQAALAFTAARAGREYTDGGAQLRRSVDDTIAALHGWSRGCADIAAQLRRCTDVYAQVDELAARRIG